MNVIVICTKFIGLQVSHQQLASLLGQNSILGDGVTRLGDTYDSMSNKTPINFMSNRVTLDPVVIK